ncbi:hypothetical protein ACTMU2_22175 [Cupriavidus basilensis]
MVRGKRAAGCHGYAASFAKIRCSRFGRKRIAGWGYLLALHGFRQFFHQRPSITWEYGAIVAILAGLVYWTYISPDVNARAAVVSGFIAYVGFGIGWLVQRYRPAGRPKYSYHFVTVAAVLGAIVHAVRCVAYAFGLSA